MEILQADLRAPTLLGDSGGPILQGDSGGPLYHFKKDVKKAVLLGVVSRGPGCARKGALGIYTRVKYHLDWIKETAKTGNC